MLLAEAEPDDFALEMEMSSTVGIGGVGNVGGVDATQSSSALSRIDQFLSKLNDVDPTLAKKLSDQVKASEQSGATPAQTVQSLRQSIDQLSGTQRDEVKQAFQSVFGKRHHGHHRHAKQVGAPTANSATTIPTTSPTSTTAGLLDVQA